MKKEKKDMAEELQNELKKSIKSKNATRIFYYMQAISSNLIAVSSYEVFIKSWAGQAWFARYKEKINELADQNNARFHDGYFVESNLPTA